MRRPLALAALTTVAAVDLVLRLRPPRWILSGALDHPAHLATAALGVLNLPPRSGRWTAGLLAGSLLPDLDHVPLALADRHPSAADPRPATHSIAVVALPLALARATGSEALAGVAAGAAAHFARDIATGPGIPLLHPVRRAHLRVPYAVYALALAALAAAAAAGGPASRREAPSHANLRGGL